jgi:formylglycine-generating enzyme required for sulfatase activity
MRTYVLLSRGAVVLVALVLAVGLACLPPSGAAPAGLPAIEPLRHKGYTQAIPGSKVRFALAAIPGGTFWRGSTPGERGRGRDEGPRHLVRIRPFWMGKCEVTWDEYDLFRKGHPASERENETALARDADAITRPTPAYPDEYRGFGREGYPVVGISHHAAMEYCRWLSRRTGKLYRLPSEAEWEYACRAGSSSAYFFGSDPRRLSEFAWFEKNSGEKTHPVGKKRANPWGLHDIYGNAAEWCLDRYERGAYRAFPLARLTLAPVRLPGAERYPHVVRGGSWADEADRCRSAARRASGPSWNRIDPANPQGIWWLWNADFVGFRVVRAVEEQRQLRGVRSRVTLKSR